MPTESDYTRVTTVILTETVTEDDLNNWHTANGMDLEAAALEDVDAITSNPELFTDALFEGDGTWEVQVTITKNEGEDSAN